VDYFEWRIKMIQAMKDEMKEYTPMQRGFIIVSLPTLLCLFSAMIFPDLGYSVVPCLGIGFPLMFVFGLFGFCDWLFK
jgi:hypothetical protein